MRLTTSAIERYRARQSVVGPLDNSMAMGGYGGDGSAGTSGFSGYDSVSSHIIDYMNQMSAAEQREWRNTNIWSDIAIRHRMDDLRDNEYSVGAKDPRKPVNTGIVGQIETLLDAPNEALEDNTFGALWGASMDDVYTIGRGSVQKLLNQNRTPRALRALDAARFRQNPKWDPDSPSATARWLFSVTLTEQKAFMADEIIMMIPYMSTHDRTGMSPMRALSAILQAELDTRRKMHYAQKYGTPPGAFIMPGAAPGSPEKARLMYDLKAAGKPGIIFMNMPATSRFIPFTDVNLMTHGTFQFYEILVRATAASFGTTPFVLGWTDQDNRANSQTQLALTDRGETAMLKFVRSIINRYIIGTYRKAYGSRANNIWFTFRALREEDEAEDADSLSKRIGADVDYISVNDVRTTGGYEPYAKEDIPKELWPFVNDIWVPSRLRGIRLPLTYAAMTWGITEDATPEEIAESLEESTSTNPLPIAMSGDDVENLPTTEPQVAGAKRALVHGRNEPAEEILGALAGYIRRAR